MGRLGPANGWRSPEERDKLELHGSGEFRLQQENAHGKVYRTGRPCVKLHAGGGEREADRDAGGGDECAVLDRGRATDPEAALHLPGGGDAVGVAVRGALAACRGGGRGGGAGEPRAEGRSARCRSD